MKVKISRAARDDLAEIGRFGAERWSAVQARRYVQKVMTAILGLADNPWRAPAAEGLAPGLRRLVSGAHAVFYRVVAEAVLIVRVLHQSRDAGLWLES